MLALSPSLFAWPLEDFMSHEQNGINIDTLETNSNQSLFQSLSFYDDSVKKSSEDNGDEKTTVKKLNHNASERDRRKKVNSLYSSLRSLLPTTDRDQTKKLSIPSTVSRALKYIPELQQEVEKLGQKKEELKLMFDKSRKRGNSETDHVMKKQKRSGSNGSSLEAVWVNKLGDGEVVIQLCTEKSNRRNIRLSEILVIIEEEGLVFLNISCLESFGDRVFYNLHVQVQATQSLNLDILRKRLLSV